MNIKTVDHKRLFINSYNNNFVKKNSNCNHIIKLLHSISKFLFNNTTYIYNDYDNKYIDNYKSNIDLNYIRSLRTFL